MSGPAVKNSTPGEVRINPARLVAFSDAVVAIALTLLILPLVDIASLIGENQPAASLLSRHKAVVGSFLLTFAVISRLWWIHFKIFETARRYDGYVVIGTMGWLLSVVVLPFTTRLIATSDDAVAYSLYVGTLIANTLFLFVLAARTAALSDGPADVRALQLRYQNSCIASTICLVVALVVGLVASPEVGYYSFSLILVGSFIRRSHLLAVARRWRHR